MPGRRRWYPGPGPAPSESTRATTWTQFGIPSVGRPVPTPSHSHQPLPAAGPTFRLVGAGGNYDSDHVHGPGPGRVIATVRVPGVRRSLPPRGHVSPLTRKVDSDGGRGKSHAVLYSRYTAPDLAPSSVLFSVITRPHGVRCLTKCLAPSLYFSRNPKRIYQLRIPFEEVLRVLAGDRLLSDAASSQTKLGL